MKDIITTVTDTLATITTTVDATEAALDEGNYQKALAEKLKDFAPGGKWAYAGQDKIREAERTHRTEWERKAAESLTPLDTLLRHVDPLIAEAEAEAEEAPGPVEAWHRHTGKAENSSAEYLQLHTLDELRRQRLSTELARLSPQELRRSYEAALRDPYDQANATFIKMFEADWKAGRINPQTGKPEDAVLLQELDRKVRETRAARVPDSVRKLKGAVAYARALSTDAHKRRGLPYWQVAPKEK